MQREYEKFSNMVKAQLYFTKQKYSFTVYIKNLEELSVSQIQELERFTQIRHGYFDFEKQCFTIQKRLDFNEFVQLLQSLHISSDIYQTTKSNQDHKVGFGKYKGMFYSDLPDSYLLWLKNNYMGDERTFIVQELKSRNL